MLDHIVAILASVCVVLGAVNGLASAVLLCVPATSKAYPVVATIATDIKSIWVLVATVVSKITGKPEPDAPLPTLPVTTVSGRAAALKAGEDK
jgi:hypothetical protein